MNEQTKRSQPSGFSKELQWIRPTEPLPEPFLPAPGDPPVPVSPPTPRSMHLLRLLQAVRKGRILRGMRLNRRRLDRAECEVDAHEQQAAEGNHGQGAQSAMQPLLIQDLQRDDVPLWGYFSQISDAVTSYGGYSGAPPNEKITWGKLAVDTPKFMIQSDATIVAPLVFAYLLND